MADLATELLFEISVTLDWLNRVVAVSVGRMTKTTVVQTIYAVL
jgi:hypothetical protein